MENLAYQNGHSGALVVVRSIARISASLDAMESMAEQLEAKLEPARPSPMPEPRSCCYRCPNCRCHRCDFLHLGELKREGI